MSEDGLGLVQDPNAAAASRRGLFGKEEKAPPLPEGARPQEA